MSLERLLSVCREDVLGWRRARTCLEAVAGFLAHDEGRGGEGGIEIGGEEQLGDSLALGWEKSEGGQGWAT